MIPLLGFRFIGCYINKSHLWFGKTHTVVEVNSELKLDTSVKILNSEDSWEIAIVHIKGDG